MKTFSVNRIFNKICAGCSILLRNFFRPKVELKNFDKMGNGYTLIEMLIASAVVIILAVIIFAGLTSFRESNNLLRGVDLVADTLNKARVQTLASKEQSGYGVRLASTSIIFFKGNGYNPSDSSNETINLPPLVEISNFANSSTSLNIVFKRLSGETDNPGTIKMLIRSNADKTKQIEVYSSGLTEIK